MLPVIFFTLPVFGDLIEVCFFWAEALGSFFPVSGFTFSAVLDLPFDAALEFALPFAGGFAF